MATEIERKFLVTGDAWRQAATHRSLIRQGYLSADADRTVRVRVRDARGFLTVKGRTVGIARDEYEYEIPVADAHAMLDGLCLRPLIEKTRHLVPVGECLWEVDEFAGENLGLVLAEVELRDAEQAVSLPDWIGREVSDDPAYFNSSLMRRPYSTWPR